MEFDRTTGPLPLGALPMRVESDNWVQLLPVDSRGFFSMTPHGMGPWPEIVEAGHGPLVMVRSSPAWRSVVCSGAATVCWIGCRCTPEGLFLLDDSALASLRTARS